MPGNGTCAGRRATSLRTPDGPREGRAGCRVVVYPGASRVETVGPPASVDTGAASRRCHISARGGGRRGVSVGYTDGSRRRLKRLLDTLERGAVPAFVTLTTADGPDGPPPPGEVERMRRAFFAALAGRADFAAVSAVWLREWERRERGAWAGAWGAHVHALTYEPGGWPARSLEAFRAFTADTWAGLGGGRVEVERARNPDAARLYLVGAEKVTGPKDRAALLAAFPDGTGRAWGTFRRDLLPTVDPIEVEVSAAECAAVRADAVDEADATYRALGSGRRYLDLPQNGRAAVSVGRPERFLAELARWRSERQPRRPRRPRRRASDRVVCTAYALTLLSPRISANGKRLRFGDSASSEPLSEVELSGFEPLASAVRLQRSTN